MEIPQDSLPPASGIRAAASWSELSTQSRNPADPSSAWVTPCCCNRKVSLPRWSAAICNMCRYTPLWPTSDLTLKAACMAWVSGEWQEGKNFAEAQLAPTWISCPGQVNQAALVYFYLMTTEGAWMTSSEGGTYLLDSWGGEVNSCPLCCASGTGKMSCLWKERITLSGENSLPSWTNWVSS